jgi:DNA-binding response OmpR family regulator
VSDIGMPSESGFALVRALRDRERTCGGRRTWAIAMTGFVGDRDRAAVLGAGFDEHLGKPVDPWTLVARVAAVTREPASVARPETAG